MKNYNYRPCYVIHKDKEDKAVFHGWAREKYPTDNGYIQHILGVVEYDDGSVALVKPRSIVFADDICKQIWDGLVAKED